MIRKKDVNRSEYKGRRDNTSIVDFNYCVEDLPDITPSPGTGDDGSNGSGGTEETVTEETVTEDTENGYNEGCIKIIHFHSIVLMM